MIYVVTTLKPSRRLPGKNEALLKYTLAWAAYALLWLQEPVKLVVAAPSMPPMPDGVRYVRLADGLTHQQALEHVQRVLNPAPSDVMVLAQVTQPLRSPELLSRVVNHLRTRGNKSAVTAVCTQRPGWRELDRQGKWGDGERGERGERTRLLDGTLYAWLPSALADIFDPQTDHTVVGRQQSWGLVDIDEAGDVPPALASMWAAVLLESKNEL